MKRNRIAINICYKDRPSELGLLLESLWRQDLAEKFDIYILDDNSGTPPSNYAFLNHIIARLKQEGHGVFYTHQTHSLGVSRNRQKLAEICLDIYNYDYICRLDDDVILEPDYMSRMLTVIKEGYDIASGVTPLMGAPETKRDIKFVKPVINRVVLDNEGKFMYNGDDCGFMYMQEEILPCHHFRSCAFYKAAIHDQIEYNSTMTNCGFREEQFFSFEALIAGFKIGVDTGAIAWHLQAPSGGDRRSNYAELSLHNQKLLNIWTQRMYKKHGDFIKDYNKRVLTAAEKKIPDLMNINKSSNLIYSREGYQ